MGSSVFIFSILHKYIEWTVLLNSVVANLQHVPDDDGALLYIEYFTRKMFHSLYLYIYFCQFDSKNMTVYIYKLYSNGK